MQRVIKIKKAVVIEQVRRVIKLKSVQPLPQPQAVRQVFKLKTKLPVPPPPLYGIALTPLAEAFEAIREYYALRDESVPQEDLKWYQAELEAEQKEMDEFWMRCAVTKAIMEATMNGITNEIALMKVQMEAKAIQKSQPLRKEDLGPMPSYGTPEFWGWCQRRKKLRLQEEAAIIAAGGTVKVKSKNKTKNA